MKRIGKNTIGIIVLMILNSCLGSHFNSSLSTAKVYFIKGENIKLRNELRHKGRREGRISRNKTRHSGRLAGQVQTQFLNKESQNR